MKLYTHARIGRVLIFILEFFFFLFNTCMGDQIHFNTNNMTITTTRPYETLHNVAPVMMITYIPPHNNDNKQQDTTSATKTTTEVITMNHDNDEPFHPTTTHRLQHFTVDRKIQDMNQNNDHFELTYTLKAQFDDKQGETIGVRYLEFSSPMELTGQIMMADGYQCWTHSREMDLNGRLPPISRTVAWWTWFNLQGDYDFFDYTGVPGEIHSNSYTYFRDEQETIFIGSLSEDSGYTYFKADYNKNYFRIYKDIDGLTLRNGETLTLRFVITRVPQMIDSDNDSDQENDNDHYSIMNILWKRYATYFYNNQSDDHGHDQTKDQVQKAYQPRHLTGWTSWYNYYERVTEADVMKSLTSFIDHKYPIDVFQIDDGYQRAIGDWLDVNFDKFPRGMHYLSDAIHDAGYIPGLWVAPFAVGFTSKIVKEHPDWLIKNKDGSNLVAGPNWGGFYALDMYHPEARDYLRLVFDTIINEWGYRLLKLDFIFAASIIPRYGKTRGQLLWEACEFIDELVDKRAIILGSGVPLAATWHRFEYNRVSSDASPFWDHSLLRLANVRERVATMNALTSTLHRWPMKHMFGVDPDVFFLRSNDNKLSDEECHSSCVINSIVGHLTLMSDDLTQYDDNRHRLYASTFPKIQPDIQRMIPIGPTAYRIDFHANHRHYITLTNLSPTPFKAENLLRDIQYSSKKYDRNNNEYNDDDDTYYYEHKNILTSSITRAWLAPPKEEEWVRQNVTLALKPHETRTFVKITDRFAGSTGHIVPGWEIESWKESLGENTIHIDLRQGRMPQQFSIFIRLNHRQENKPTIFVDGQPTIIQDHSLDTDDLRVGKITIQ